MNLDFTQPSQISGNEKLDHAEYSQETVKKDKTSISTEKSKHRIMLYYN